MSASTKPVPPAARQDPKRIERLGRVRVDEYHWMKDDNWQAVLRDPSLIKADVKEHLTAENAYTRAMLAPTEALQQTLFEEMKGRIKEDDSSVPAPDGPWEYYARYETGAQHPVRARRPRGRADGEVVLLDEDAESRGKAYYETGTTAHSPDHVHFAWSADTQGSEVYRVLVRDIASGALVGEPIESVYDFCWSPDSKWLFWILRDDNAAGQGLPPDRWAAGRRTTCWSMTSPTRASSWASACCPRRSGSASASATRRPARSC